MSDKTGVEISGHKALGENQIAYQHKHLMPTLKHGGGGVMI